MNQNAPNPFNPSTVISWTAPAVGPLSVEIYNVRGERVATPHSGEVQPGPGSVRWDGRDHAGHEVGSGVYLYKVRGFGREEVRKMALLR